MELENWNLELWERDALTYECGFFIFTQIPSFAIQLSEQFHVVPRPPVPPKPRT